MTPSGNVATQPLQFEALPPGSIDRDYVPRDEADMLRCLGDPFWRLESGQLYKITVKAGKDEAIVPFRPKRAQRRFLRRIWHRNVILKARQLGFTTLISIMWLDHALFNEHQLCVQVAQTREDAEAILTGKVFLAYDHLPEALKAAKPARRRTATRLDLMNGSTVKVATSARGGTPHRLHVSEMGKIAAKFPDKAKEIVSGSFPAVPLDGVLIVESTAEGQDGHFKGMVDDARELQQKGVPLNPKQMRFHFYPWWGEPEYRLTDAQAALVPITAKEHEYFDKLEGEIGQPLALGQRAWWVATLASECLGDLELMWREYPSTPDEAFQVSTEGAYYAEQLKRAREAGRIGKVPHLAGYEVNTFWDIGSGDGTGIWLHQRVGLEDRFFKYLEGWDKGYGHYIKELQKVGTEHDIVWGTHHLPHDADHQRQQADKTSSPSEELQAIKGIGGKWVTVPRVDDLTHGIQLTRKAFSSYCFDEAGCKEGLAHLAGYKKRWNRSTSTWADEPLKNEHTEAADALRQHAQGFRAKTMADKAVKKKRPINWKTR
jgi:hypothetical protein